MVNLTFKLILIGYGLGQQAGTSEQSLHAKISMGLSFTHT